MIGVVASVALLYDLVHRVFGRLGGFLAGLATDFVLVAAHYFSNLASSPRLLPHALHFSLQQPVDYFSPVLSCERGASPPLVSAVEDLGSEGPRT